MKNAIDYWFTIEPYVFIGITNKSVLLYNTIDGVTLTSDKSEVIDLFREILKIENCGVILLTNKRYSQRNVKDFIRKLRSNFMGDVIDISLSKGKPIQLLPYYNFPEKNEVYKKHNFSSLKNLLENLFEITIHLDPTSNVKDIISFLQPIPGSPTFNIIGNIEEVSNFVELLNFLDKYPSPKYILCSYEKMVVLQPTFKNNFSYQISVQFPIDWKQWDILRQKILKQTLPVEYVFDISTDENLQQAQYIIDRFKIETYRLNPVYNGNNISFFEKNVFLTQEDILSTPLTIKDFFSRQSMNIYDFGKINIMPNGDTFANINHPSLGNIHTDNIYEIVSKEVEIGVSWFRIRNQTPCNDCVYQWICPSPSNYEISIGRPNLCHVKN